MVHGTGENPNECISRENIYTMTLCEKFLTQLKYRKIKIGVILLHKILFLFARLSRFLYFGDLNTRRIKSRVGASQC